ncbi:MAG: sulfatase-like hydrolase/transferase [Lentisphaeria bacterium]|nr:sulfatase-like hydrolase/transferase [Lentisphaeria bacterium]
MPKPNIIFILSDQHRWDFMGYETNGITHTPNLDKLAARGVRANNAYCPAPLCSPSRAAMATGRYAMNSGCFTNLHKVPASTPTFNKELKKAGYTTMVIGKIHMEIHHYQSDLASPAHKAYMKELGWDDTFEVVGNGLWNTGIKDQYSKMLDQEGLKDQVLQYYNNWGYFMDKRVAMHPLQAQVWPFEEKYQESYLIGKTAVNWIKEQPKDKPYFLHLGFTGPHSPTEPNQKFLDLYDVADETQPVDNESPWDWLPEGRTGYRAMITQIDHYIGDVIKAVEERGELDNTIIIYTSDHGEMMGDHGRTDKGSFYEGSAHVPFVAAGPGIQHKETNALIELLDLGKSFCDFAGVESHPLDQGESLKPVLEGNTDYHRDTVFCEMGCDKMIFDGRYKLIYGEQTADKREGLGRIHLDKPVTIPRSPAALFDLKEDPNETNNLFDNPDYVQLKIEMLEKLLARINENTQPSEFLDRGVYNPPTLETACPS